jgi:hypothetical protein
MGRLGVGEEQYEGLAYWQVVRVAGVRVGLPSAAMTIVPGRSGSSVVGRDGRSQEPRRFQRIRL